MKSNGTAPKNPLPNSGWQPPPEQVYDNNIQRGRERQGKKAEKRKKQLRAEKCVDVSALPRPGARRQMLFIIVVNRWVS